MNSDFIYMGKYGDDRLPPISDLPVSGQPNIGVYTPYSSPQRNRSITRYSESQLKSISTRNMGAWENKRSREINPVDKVREDFYYQKWNVGQTTRSEVRNIISQTRHQNILDRRSEAYRVGESRWNQAYDEASLPSNYLDALRGDYSYRHSFSSPETYAKPPVMDSNYAIQQRSRDIWNTYQKEMQRPHEGWQRYLTPPAGQGEGAGDFIRGLFSKQSSALFAGSVGLHFASSLALQPLREFTQLDLSPAIQFQKETIMATNPMGLGGGIVGLQHLPHFQKLIKQMSLSYSQSPVELMQSARKLAQAGMTGKEILGILPPALKFSEMTAGSVGITESADIARMIVRKFNIEPTESAITTAFSQMFRADQTTSLSVEDMAIALNSLSSAPLEFSSSQLPEYLATIGMLRDMGQMPAQAAATTAGFMRSISRMGVTEARGIQKLELAGFFEDMGISRRHRPHYRDLAYYSYFGTNFTDQLSVTKETLDRYAPMGKKEGDLIPIPEIIGKVSGQLVYKRDSVGNLILDEEGKPVKLSEFERSAKMSQLGFSSQFKNVLFGYQQMQEGQGAVWNEDLKAWVAEGRLLARGYNDIIREITSSTKALDIGFKNMSGTLIQVSNRLESSKEAFITTMGESLIPAKTQSAELRLSAYNWLNKYIEDKPARTSLVAGGFEGFSKGIGVAKGVTDLAGGGLMSLAMIKTLTSRYMTPEEIAAGNAPALAAKAAMMEVDPEKAALMGLPYNAGDMTWNKSAVRFGAYVGGGLLSIARGMSTGYSAYSTGALMGKSPGRNITASIGAGLWSGGFSMASVPMFLRGGKAGFGAGAALLGLSAVPDISNYIMSKDYDKSFNKRYSALKEYSNQLLGHTVGFYETLSETDKVAISNITGIPKDQLDLMTTGGSLDEMYKDIAMNFSNTYLSEPMLDRFRDLAEIYPDLLQIKPREAEHFKHITTTLGGKHYLLPSTIEVAKGFGGGNIGKGMQSRMPGVRLHREDDKEMIRKYVSSLSEEEQSILFGHIPSQAASRKSGAAWGAGIGVALSALLIKAGVIAAPFSAGMSVPASLLAAGAIGSVVTLGTGAGLAAGDLNRLRNISKSYPQYLTSVSGGEGTMIGGVDLGAQSITYAASRNLNQAYISEQEHAMKMVQSGAETVDALNVINENLKEFMKALFSAGSSARNQVTVNQIFKSADRELLKQQAYQMGDIITKNMERLSERSFSELNLIEVSK